MSNIWQIDGKVYNEDIYFIKNYKMTLSLWKKMGKRKINSWKKLWATLSLFWVLSSMSAQEANLQKFDKDTVVAEYSVSFDSAKKDIQEVLEISKESLLNKPNMTEKDKEWMQKSINYLVERNMYNLDNVEKLNSIVYTKDYVEIGSIKWVRQDISSEPNNKTIFQENNITFFNRNNEEIKKQDSILHKQWMCIPSYDDYQKSLQSLPGVFSGTSMYDWWNIIAFILNMWNEGSFIEGNSTFIWNSFRWALSSWWNYDYPSELITNNDRGGILTGSDKTDAYPIRPIFK